MKILNTRLMWLSLVVPLVGCSTVSLDDQSAKQAVQVVESKKVQEPKAVNENNSGLLSVLSFKSNPEAKPVENHQVINVSDSEITVSPLKPSEAKAMKAQVGGKAVLVDPNVQLIAPPTSLPKTTYAVPKVAEKEEFVPRAKSVKTKKGGKKSAKATKTGKANKQTKSSAKKSTSTKQSAKKEVKKTVQKKEIKSSKNAK